MLYSLPPWLSVTPQDFLAATQAGAQLGKSISDSAQRAWEEQQRMQMAAQQQEARMQQLAVENAQQRLAADRLEAYRQQEVANRQAQLAAEREGLGLRKGQLDVEGRRADEQARRNAILEGIRMDAETRKEQEALRKANAPAFHGGQWWQYDPEEGMVPLTEPPTDKERPGHFYTDPKGTLWTIPPGQTNAVKVNFPNPQAESGASESTIMPSLVGAIPGTALGLSKFALGANPVLHSLAPLTSMYGGSEPAQTPKRLRYNPETGKLESPTD